MKKFKMMKVTISLLCVLSLLVGSMLTFSLVGTAAASEVPTGLTEITWSDLGMGGTYTGDTSGTAADTSVRLDDTLISGYVTFTGVGDIRVAGIKSNWNWGGVLFQLNGDQLKLDGSVAVPGAYALLEPAAAGLTTFAGTEFLLQMSVQYVDNDGDGAEDDLKLGAWANGVMLVTNMAADDGYTYVNDHTDYLTKGMMAYPRNGGTVTLRDYKAFPSGLTEYGWDDMGNGDAGSIVIGEAVIYTGGYYAYSKDASAVGDTIFNGDLIIPVAAGGQYIRWFDNTNGWYGIQMRVDAASGSLVLEKAEMKFDTASSNYLLAPSKFGLTTFTNTQFNLKMAITNRAADGTTATLTVWINDYFALEVGLVAASGKEIGSLMVPVAAAGAGAVAFTPCETTKPMPEEQPDEPEDEPETPAVTVPDGFTEITWSDMGVEDGGYTGHNHTSYVLAANENDYMSLNKTFFNGYVTFGGESDLRWAGYDGWQGLIIAARADGYLQILNSTYGTADGAEYAPVYSPADFGLEGTTFIGQEINLKISTEIEGDNFTFGVWVNDVMAGDYFTLVKGGTPGAQVGIYDRGTGSTTTVRSAELVEEQPEEGVTVPDGFTEITWSDMGVEDGGYTGHNHTSYVLAENENDYMSLNKTFFNGYVTFGGEADLRWVGYDGWQGLIIAARADGYLQILNSTYGTADGAEYAPVYSPADFGLTGTTFIGQELNLKISTEIEGDNFTFGVWVNDVMADDYFTLTKGSCIPGAQVGIYDRGTGSTTTVRSAELDNEPDDEPEVVVPETDPNIPTDLTVLEWDDFAPLTNATYPGVAGDLAAKGTYNGSLDGTMLDGEIALGADTQIRYAGNDGWQGLIVGLNATGDLVVQSSTFGTTYNAVCTASAFGLETLIDTTVNLKIALDIDDSGENYTFRIWINDIKAGEAFTLAKGSCGVGSVIGLYAFNSKNAITLSGADLSEPDEPTPPVVTPSLPSEDLTKITFHSYGVADGAYAADQMGMYAESIDGTIFSGYVKHSLANHFRLGGTSDGSVAANAKEWGGLIYIANGASLVVNGSVAIPNWYIEVSAEALGMTTLIDAEYFLQQSVEFVDSDGDGAEDDLKLGIWVNGVMLAPKAMNDSGCASDGYVYVVDGAATFGNLMLVCPSQGESGGTVTVRSDENVEEEFPEPPATDVNIPTDYTVLEWDDFAPLTNATYPAVAGDLAARGTYNGSLDGTMLDGDIAFGAGTQIRYAGNNGWQGLILGLNAGGQLVVESSTFGTTYSAVYAPSTFGLETLIDTTVNLKLAVDIDGDNYTFRIWINDVKAGEAFTLAKGDCLVGSVIGLYDALSGNAITLSGADVPQKPKPTDPSKLLPISLKSFGIADTTLKPDTTVSGVMMYPVSYDGTVFKVTLDMTNTASTGGTYIRFGGPDGGWNGLGLQTAANGLLQLIEWHNPATASSAVATLDPQVAGVDFYNGPFDVQISFEYVAADADGVKNDVLVGVYFNGKAYNEDGFVVKDFEMANTLLMNIETLKDEDGNTLPWQPMTVTGVDDVAFLPFDFGQFGFTENFKDTFKDSKPEKVKGVPLGVTLAPFTGEPIEACFWIVVMAAAVAFGVLLIVKRVARKTKQ